MVGSYTITRHVRTGQVSCKTEVKSHMRLGNTTSINNNKPGLFTIFPACSWAVTGSCHMWSHLAGSHYIKYCVALSKVCSSHPWRSYEGLSMQWDSLVWKTWRKLLTALFSFLEDWSNILPFIRHPKNEIKKSHYFRVDIRIARFRAEAHVCFIIHYEVQ